MPEDQSPPPAPPAPINIAIIEAVSSLLVELRVTMKLLAELQGAQPCERVSALIVRVDGYTSDKAPLRVPLGMARKLVEEHMAELKGQLAGHGITKLPDDYRFIPSRYGTTL